MLRVTSMRLIRRRCFTSVASQLALDQVGIDSPEIRIETRQVPMHLAEDLLSAKKDEATGEYLHPRHWKYEMTTLMDVLKWKWNSTAPGAQVPTNEAELDAALPVLTPDFSMEIPWDHARITWLGHASVLLEVPVDGKGNKMTILTDPVFTARCSPVQWAGPKRYRPAPLQVNTLPNIDVVVISHNHYDHLDNTTIEQLAARFPNVQWFIPLDNSKFLTPLGVSNAQIIEQNWWDSTTISYKNSSSFTFSLVPVQHYSRRYFHDTNQSLWGGWVVQGLGGSFFFSGDTAYCSSFKAINHRFGKQSVSAIPIGAYGPREVLHNQHCDVAQAIQIHKDVNSASSLGIHWGTWVLTEEFYLEPKQDLERLMNNETDCLSDSFYCLDHGASKVVKWRLTN
ncbi:N-acyl-phosphatidylethanolamine-hydrolyzing phospholipase D-like [Thraustotheca clavata]|uniref:N-acyl-phosphatidylethanolamine-hydrolyzing phospholipase D-like n=1 Tax=Thraustotheca clavata TaxID=74557 RepID=A0A1V9Z5L9_9STRA|nr:N-acyl-phosphatidylethanolamine-hydrolyzing phospholipase D-like [Thraustotheca clavata]